MKKLKDQFGEDEEQIVKGDTPLQITQGKGEDEEEDLETKLKAEEPKLVEVSAEKKKKTSPKRKSQEASSAPKKRAKVTKALATRANTRVATELTKKEKLTPQKRVSTEGENDTRAKLKK